MTLQPAAILFPDAEMWGIEYLREALVARTESYAFGVKVSNAVPSSFTRLVTVRRDGGTSDGLFDRPRLGINVWAATEQDVADLTRLVVALLFVTPGDGVCVRMTQQGGPSPIPDSKPRRFMTWEATLRGEVL